MQPTSTPDDNNDAVSDTPADAAPPRAGYTMPDIDAVVAEPTADVTGETAAVTSPIAAMASETVTETESVEPAAPDYAAAPPVVSPIAAMASSVTEATPADIEVTDDAPMVSPIAAMASETVTDTEPAAGSPAADFAAAAPVTSPVAAMASETDTSASSIATPDAVTEAPAPTEYSPPSQPAEATPTPEADASPAPAVSPTPETPTATEPAPIEPAAATTSPEAAAPDSAPGSPETTAPVETPVPAVEAPSPEAAASTVAASETSTAPASSAAPDDGAASSDQATGTSAATDSAAAASATPDTGSTPAATPSIGDSAPPTIGASAPAGGPGGPPPVAPGEAKPPPVAAYGFTSGQILTGKILSIAEDGEVEVDLDHSRLGVIQKGHIDPKLAASGLMRVGADIEAAVLVRDDPKGRAVLSNTWARKLEAWKLVDKAMADNEPFDVTVSEAVKGGLVIDLGIRAFMPASHVDLSHVEDLSTYVGQTLPALVVEVDKANDKVVLSRRNVLRRAEKGKVAEFIKSLENGQVVKGRVATLTDFGAFVDVQGARGLLHMSEMAWHRIDKPSDVVRPGQDIEVKVIGVKKGGKRISLSLREMSPDPITSVTVGEVVQGTVTRLADFGAFVQIGTGAEGLVHISELSEYRISLPEEVVMPGEELQVKIIGVDAKRRRIDLSVIQAVQY